MNKTKTFIGFILLLLTSACTLPAATPEAQPTLTQTPLPPPTTISVTPSLVPTETATPTQEPPPLYFTEEFETSTPYWQFQQAGGAASSSTPVFDGSLKLEMLNPNTWWVGAYTANEYENVLVRARVAIDPNGSVGLICRYSETGWYEFNITQGTLYSFLLGQWLAPGIVQYKPILISEGSLLSHEGPKEIGLLCEENFLQAYIGETMLRRVEVTNYGLQGGGVGLAASAFNEIPASAVFEWFQVTEP